MGGWSKKRKRTENPPKEVGGDFGYESDASVSKSETKKRKKKLKKPPSVDSIRKKQLMEANEEEDRSIKRLEKLLKMNKRKGKKLPSGFQEDGLDYILGALDCNEEDRIMSDCSDDLEQDLALVKGSSNAKKLTRPNIFKETSQQRTLTDLMKEKGQSLSEDEESVENDDFSDMSSESNKNSNLEEEEGGNDESEEEEKDDKDERVKPKVWEDIYGRLRDGSGKVVKHSGESQNLYVPPKLRKETAPPDERKQEECVRIKRQLKGLLNRLSESNMQNIGNQIEEMFMKYSRNDMSVSLFGLMSELLFVSVPMPPRLVLEQGMLVALLHANIGSEIGAYFLQHIVELLETLFQSSENYGEGKHCNNVLIFLSHLYNYKVTHSTLVFDIFHRLIESFKSKDIELIQLLLKNIGFVLRKDDPLKLKEMIFSIQAKATSYKKDDNDSRVRFMLETLTAIRNNNMYKIPDYDPSISDHSKKLLRGLIRKGCSVQELSISYDDLLRVEERGRWWIVGSAWAEPDDPKGSKNVKDSLPRTVMSEKMLELAQKQHMNTDVRKSVFCIIVSAEDFMDAFEKLLKLNLKNQQEREIVNVLLHCLLNETTFNPFYAYLAGKFCSFARKYLINLQFSLWDRFKDLGKMKSFQLNNLSCFLGQLFKSGALPLSVLKVIHFSDMNKTMVRFFRQILLSLLLDESEEVVTRAFARISTADNLKILREGLRLFMHHFLLRNTAKMEASVALTLHERVKLAEGILNAHKHTFKL